MASNYAYKIVIYGWGCTPPEEMKKIFKDWLKEQDMILDEAVDIRVYKECTY